jgi:hypothetical protein
MAKASPGKTDIEALLDALGQLKSVVEEQLASVHDRLEHVAEVVREAVKEIGVLRDAIDEEREVIEWAVQNDKPVFQLTSMLFDSADPRWAKHVTTLTPADLPPAEIPAEHRSPSVDLTKQGRLF